MCLSSTAKAGYAIARGAFYIGIIPLFLTANVSVISKKNGIRLSALIPFKMRQKMGVDRLPFVL
jgi:hypothetical protein